jgi:hypothetical protein
MLDALDPRFQLIGYIAALYHYAHLAQSRQVMSVRMTQHSRDESHVINVRSRQLSTMTQYNIADFKPLLLVRD